MTIPLPSGDTLDPERDLLWDEIDLTPPRHSERAVPYALRRKQLHRQAERQALRRERRRARLVGHLFEGRQ